MTALKDQVDMGNVWKLAKIGMLLGVGFTVAACSFMKSAECSSDDTRELIASIVSDKVKERLGHGGYFGLTKEDIDQAISTISLEIDGIRTLGGEKGAGGFTCEGSLVVNLNQEQIAVASLPLADADPRRSVIGYNDFTRQGFDGQRLTTPISYSVQQTDDGDNLYGEISSLDIDFINAYASLALQAVKNAKVANAPEEAPSASAIPVSQSESPAMDESTVAQSAPAEPESVSADLSVAPIRPSFNCEKAATATEKLICSDAELASLDVTLAKAYKDHLAGSADKKTTKQEQLAWIKGLAAACSDADCLKAAYRGRISVLSSAQ